MEYKVGDEVWVRGKIAEVDTEDTCDRPYLVKTSFGTSTWVPGKESEVIDKTYTQGLADAWELAKKIMLAKYGFSDEQIKEIFGVFFPYEVLKNMTAEEALAKIEAYEKEKEIKVGDVVKILGGNGKGVIVSVGDGAAHILWMDGVSGTYTKSHIEKTGKHIDIENLLKQIGE